MSTDTVDRVVDFENRSNWTADDLTQDDGQVIWGRIQANNLARFFRRHPTSHIEFDLSREVSSLTTLLDIHRAETASIFIGDALLTPGTQEHSWILPYDDLLDWEEVLDKPEPLSKGMINVRLVYRGESETPSFEEFLDD